MAVERCERHLGRFCYVPIGKSSEVVSPLCTASDHLEGLKGETVAGTQSPGTLPEVRFLSVDADGGDVCLSYGVASALHAFGDVKLQPLIIASASELEQRERQMEALRTLAQQNRWQAKAIIGEDAAAFRPLDYCSSDSIYVLHLKEIDGAEDHAVAIARSFIFDANRTHALPLSHAGLAAINYAGAVSATRLTPSRKIADAISRRACRPLTGQQAS